MTNTETTIIILTAICIVAVPIIVGLIKQEHLYRALWKYNRGEITHDEYMEAMK